MTKNRFCEPSNKIVLRRVRGNEYYNMSRDRMETMSGMLCTAAKMIVKKYKPEQMEFQKDVSSCIEITMPSEVSAAIREICAKLNVSTSDFMKIELYNQLILKNK